eukprot:5640288-Heterocapsa_arctica.AAC.1
MRTESLEAEANAKAKSTVSGKKRVMALMRHEHHAILQAEKAEHYAVLQEQQAAAANAPAEARHAAALELQRSKAGKTQT